LLLNAFISLLNPNEQDSGPFCGERVVVKEKQFFHCFKHCERQRPLFGLLEILFSNVNEVFTMCLFLVLNIVKKRRRKDGC